MRRYILLFNDRRLPHETTAWRTCWSDDDQTVETVMKDVQTEMGMQNIPMGLVGCFEVEQAPSAAGLPGMDWGRFGGVFK